MSEPRARKKSLNDLTAQMQRIYDASGGYRAMEGENASRYERAINAFEKYYRNIVNTKAYQNAMSANENKPWEEQDEILDNMQFSRAQYMGRRNNRR